MKAAASGVRVVKIGGGELDDAGWLARLARELKAVLPVVVVHGGGRDISAWQRRLGIPVDLREGIRVTTLEVAELAHMVLCGPVRSRILRALRSEGLDAVGLAGADGIWEVELVDPGQLGRVGRVTRVDRDGLMRLLDLGCTPVLAPSSSGSDGLPVNVNADQAAAAVARALGADELLFVSDVPGVLLGGKPVEVLRAGEVSQLVSSGVVQGGMVAKLSAAIASGCARVRIGNLDALTHSSGGTLILTRSEAAA